MATEIERERTYLARALPEGLEFDNSEIIADHYIPADSRHPVIRIRRVGDRYEMTKKQPLRGLDSSVQTEDTIVLDKAEYNALMLVPGKSFIKRRYYTEIDGHSAEVDVYLEDLEGLVVIDFEFDSDEALNKFQTPAVCLADVTQELFVAGGVLAGKKYTDLAKELSRYEYQRIEAGEEEQL